MCIFTSKRSHFKLTWAAFEHEEPQSFFERNFHVLIHSLHIPKPAKKTKLKFSCQVHFNISLKVDLIKFLSCRENAKKGLPLESGTVKIQNNICTRGS